MRFQTLGVEDLINILDNTKEIQSLDIGNAVIHEIFTEKTGRAILVATPHEKNAIIYLD